MFSLLAMPYRHANYLIKPNNYCGVVRCALFHNYVTWRLYDEAAHALRTVVCFNGINAIQFIVFLFLFSLA